MRTLTRSKVITIFGAAAVLFTGVSGVSTAQAVTTAAGWSMEQLSTVPGMSAGDLNDSGQMFGMSANGQPVRWNRKVTSPLPQLPGAAHSMASAINNSGTIAGASVLTGQVYGVVTVWTGSSVAATSPAIAVVSGVDINDSGQIVGTLASGGAFLWSHGQLVDLGVLGQPGSTGASINDAGVMAGITGGRIYLRAPDGSLTYIPVPGPFYSLKINNVGQVLYTLDTGNEIPPGQPYLWSNGLTTPVMVPGCISDLFPYAADIDSQGQVIGTCQTPSGSRAFVWKNGVAQWLPMLSGSTESSASGINDRGEVVGGMKIGANYYTVVWHESGQLWYEVYTSPGYRISAGHEWYTSCESYGTTATRCTALIKATQVKLTSTGYVAATGWVFNNLTYTDQASTAWSTNPLAVPGTFTSAGRLWYTTCTPNVATGPRTCRTYIWATVYGRTALPTGGYVYWSRNQWVFNNMVVLS
jgi:probable HAF family extracellular repeat protein